MRTMNQTFTLTTLAAALLSLYGPAIAADDAEKAATAPVTADSSQPLQDLPSSDVLDLVKPSSSVSIGAGYLGGDDRRQLGTVGGVRDTGGYLLLDADVNRRDDATGIWQSLYATNLGMDSREIRAEYQQQGNQGVAVEYRQSKREVPYLVNTGVTGIGTATQYVPFPSITPGTGTDVQLGTERSKYGIEFFKYLMPSLKFKVNISNEDKEGDRIGRVGGQPEFAAIPIDWHVRKFDATFDYVLEKLQLSGGYNGSWFINDNDLLTVYRRGTGAFVNAYVPYHISQPLDSEAHQFFLDGGYSFTPTTRGTFKLSYTHATQDEHIPTSDITTAIPGVTGWPVSATSPSNLDGEVNTTLLQFGLTSRPMPKLNLLANLRYHKVDEQTPEWFVVDTATDAHSTPFDYETLTGKVEGTYNLPQDFNLTAGIDYTDQDRTVPVGTLNVTGQDTERYVPMRSNIDEITYRVQLRRSMSETVNGALAFLHSKRDGSAYSEAIHSEPGEGIHPDAIDPINIADRDRNKWRLTLDWIPSDALNLQVNYENAQDDYSGHTYGLRDGSAWLFSLDTTYVISKDWQVTAWYSHDYTEANQRGWREGSPAATGVTNAELDKWDNLEDTGDSIGLGMKGLINPKLKIGADVQWTRTRSEYNQEFTKLLGGGATYIAGTGGPLPDIESTMTRIKLFAEYALKKSADLRFDLIHERWDTNDWTWQFANGSPFIFGSGTGTTSSDGTMITTEPEQNSTFFGARYVYKFQ